MIDLFYYATTNFGDRVSPDIVRYVSGKDVQLSYTSPKLLAVGSILRLAQSGDTIWGTGAMDSNPWGDTVPTDLHITAVRGPLTRNVLLHYGIPCPELYGDPGILLPAVYPVQRTSTYRLGILPHYIDRDKMDELRQYYPESFVIDITDPPARVMECIAMCDTIISSSLHGIIAAEALGIPAAWTPLSDRVAGGSFKFHDYYLGSGRPAKEPSDWRSPVFVQPADFNCNALMGAFPDMTNTFTLLLDYAPHPNSVRAAELNECLEHNLSNKYIDEIHLLTPLKTIHVQHPKLKVIPTSAPRNTYNDFIAYASCQLQGKLVIIANGDIKFNDTLQQVRRYNMHNTILALSRDDLRNPDSQDAWIFKSPLPNIDKIAGNYTLGILGCDNSIAYTLKEATRYSIRNPCKTVILEHVHRKREIYSGPPRISQPYLFVSVE